MNHLICFKQVRPFSPPRCTTVSGRTSDPFPRPPPRAQKRSLCLRAHQDDKDDHQLDEVIIEDPQLPSFGLGLNTYCYWLLGLIFLIDLTPLGSALAETGPDALPVLAALQYGLFLTPTALMLRNSSGSDDKPALDLQRTFALNGACPAELLASILGGFAAWALVTGLTLLRGGGVDSQAAATSVVSATSALTGGLSPYSLQVFLFLALAPAVAEELLFRGFLLSAFKQRFGRFDAVALNAGAFALIHLDTANFFGFSVLGAAAGLAATAANESVFAAILLHITYNASALFIGSSIDPGDPNVPLILIAAGVLCGAAAVRTFLTPRESIPCAGGGDTFFCEDPPAAGLSSASGRSSRAPPLPSDSD